MNETIFHFFNNFTHKSYFFDQIIIFSAVYFIYFVILAAFIFLIFKYRKELKNHLKEFVYLGISIGVAWSLAKILKIIIHTLRPQGIFPQIQPLFLETGFAFPSGHTTVASAIAFTLFFRHKRVGFIFIFFALIIGVSRIMSGVHFPVDILGGFTLGFLIAYLLRNV